MEIKSYAKINLALYVKDKREDGFHNIETIFRSIGLFDTISIEESDKLIVETDNKDIPSGPKNFAFQTVELIKKEFNIKKNVRIFINKRIPSGAGLAGGSSNSAAVYKGLLEFWKIKSNREQNLKLLSTLGSDMAYCFLGGTCLGSGRGEILTPLKSYLNFKIVLVYPEISVSTPWAYKNLKKTLTQSQQNISLNIRLDEQYKELSENKIDIQSFLHNDFENIVFSKYKEIENIKNDFKQFNPKGCLMSGSGSTVFALFKDNNNANKAFDYFNKKSYRTFKTNLLD